MTGTSRRRDDKVELVRRWLRGAVRTLSDAALRRWIWALPPPTVRMLNEEWPWQAHRGQGEPEGDWRVWLLMAGRGVGKTRAGV